MKNKHGLIMLALGAILLTGCATSEGGNNGQATTITDMVGRNVEIKPGTYKKVVCIGAGALRLYSYIGDVKLLSGVEDIDNYTLEKRPKMFDTSARPYFLVNKEIFKTLPSCGVGGPNAQAAEAEKILSCDPDIVISEYEDADKANALQKQLGVPVVTVKYGYKGVFDDAIKNSLNLLGNIFKEKTKATKLNKYIADQKELISKMTKDLKSKESVYICGLGNWRTTDHLMTVQNYEPFNVANINNVVTDLSKDGIQKIEKEKLVSLGDKIDKMIIDAAAIKNIKMTDDTKLVLNSIKAWKNNEVYLQMPYNAYYTNVETALANTWYNAKIVYADAFKDIDMKEKVNEITKAFLNKELADEIFSCPTSFGGYQKIDVATFFNK